MPNRRYFIDQLQIYYRSEAVEREQFHADVFIDLDHFKNINDARGHGIGDVYLAALATRLAELMHPDDIVVRFGGDEFVVLAVNLGGTMDDAGNAAAALQKKCGRRCWNRHPSMVTFIFAAPASA